MICDSDHVVPAAVDDETDNVVDYNKIISDVNANTCPFARAVEVMTPFLPASPPEISSVCMISSTFLGGSALRIQVTIRGQEFPVLPDSVAEISVLPVDIARFFSRQYRYLPLVHPTPPFLGPHP